MISDFKKKIKSQRKLKSPFFFFLTVILIIIFVSLVFLNYKIYQKKKELILRVNFSQDKINEFKQNIQTLKEKIKNSEDKEYLEKVAYEELGEEKQGEKSIIFVMHPQTDSAENSSQSFQKSNFFLSFLNALNRFLNWLKVNF